MTLKTFAITLSGFLLCSLACLSSVCAEEALSHTLQTKFSTIRYGDEKELGDFLWRITGDHGLEVRAVEKIRNRVDEITERVRSLLDMYHDPFHFDIHLGAQKHGNPIAHYSRSQKTISVSTQRVTDGILAHEIAHAVICQSFSQPPPEKAQEIMAQYVDKHLWNEANEYS